MSSFLRIAAAVCLISIGNTAAFAQTVYQWRGPATSTWLTTGNWINGGAGQYPGSSAAAGSGSSTDIAQFTSSVTSSNVGISMASAGGSLSLGAIQFATTSNTLIGNSSASAGILQLNGQTVNGVANTLVNIDSTITNNSGSAITHTITNVASGGTSTMGLRLGITNGVFNIYGDASPNTGIRSLVIGSNITETNAGSGFTLQGGGNLSLTGTNSFTGDINIISGRLQVGSSSALGTGAGVTNVSSGGTLHFNTAVTVSENINFAGNGFTEASQLFGAIRVGNVAVTLNGNLTMTGDSRFFIDGNTTTINGTLGESGGARNISLAGAGTVALQGVGNYSGTTAMSQMTLNLTGTAGSLTNTSAISVTDGATLRLSNTSGTSNLTDRLRDATPITLSNGTFNFSNTAVAATNYSETAGPLTISHYANTVSTSQAASGQTSTLTFASIGRTANTGVVNFAGTGLGTNTQNQVLFTSAPTLVGGATQATGGIIGGWATYNVTATTADFASYGANGVTAMGNVTSDTTASNWTSTSNAKLPSGGFFVSGNPANGVNSLTMVLTNGADIFTNVIATGGTLRIGSGGILQTSSGTTATTNNTNFAASTTLTAGTAANTPGELIFNINAGQITLTGGVVNNGTGQVSMTKTGAGLLVIATDQLNLTGPLVIAGNGAGSGVRLDNNDGLGSISSVTLKATTGGSPGTFLNLNTQLLAPVNVPLTIEGFLTGGLGNAISTQGPTGLNYRSSLVTNSNNTWSGPITLSGNYFAGFHQTTAGNTLTLSGPITGPSFTGIMLVRGSNGGIVDTSAGSINLPSGTVAVTDGARLNLPANASTLFGINPQNGNIRLGASNALNNSVVVYLGQNGNGNQGQFWTNGFNQTIASLNIQNGSTAATTGQIVQNGAGANSLLTFAGNASPSTFAGVIQDGGSGLLGLAVTQGKLYLNGTNTYTGGTTVSGTGTLGGTGTITGALNINSGGTLAPGNSIGTLTVSGAGSVTTWAGGGKYAIEYNHQAGLPFTTGSTIDFFNSAGSLTLTATAGTPFILDLKYLGLANNASGTATSITIATFANGISGFDPTKFSVTGDFYLGTTPSVSQIGNNLVLNFTPVPEPMTIGLIAATAGAFILRRRKTKAVVIQSC